MTNKLLVGLHKDQYGRFDPYLQIYEKILDYNGIKNVRVEASQPGFWEIVSGLDLIIFHWVYIDRDQQMADALMPVIEKEMGICCFPDWNTFWHYNDKIKQYYLLKSHNFPVIESYPFWEKNLAEEWIDSTEFPLVFKLNRGALSQDVMLVKHKRQAYNLITRMFGKGILPGRLHASNKHNLLSFLNNLKYSIWQFKGKIMGTYIELWWNKEKDYVFFQKFLPANPYTTRITIIGDRAFAFNIKTAVGDFRAYDMQGVCYDKKELDMECIKIAFKISKTFHFQCMAYDFLFNEDGEPKICEMGYTSKALDIYNCSGYWDNDLNWYEGHYWPQYLQLVDALKLSDLKQPEIELDSLNNS